MDSSLRIFFDNESRSENLHFSKLNPVAFRDCHQDWKNWDFTKSPGVILLNRRSHIQPPDVIPWKGPQDLSAMLRCLAAREAHYPRGALLLLAGQPVREMGLVLDGHAVVLTEDYWGNRNILSSLQAGDLFAEVFACNPGFPAQVSVEAAGEVSVLWLDGGKVLAPCCSGCTFHLALIRRLFEMVTKKN